MVLGEKDGDGYWIVGWVEYGKENVLRKGVDVRVRGN